MGRQAGWASSIIDAPQHFWPELLVLESGHQRRGSEKPGNMELLSIFWMLPPILIIVSNSVEGHVAILDPCPQDAKFVDSCRFCTSRCFARPRLVRGKMKCGSSDAGIFCAVPGYQTEAGKPDRCAMCEDKFMRYYRGERCRYRLHYMC